MRYFIDFEYNGTAYHGWQLQPNANSVQAEMEKAFSTIFRRPTSLVAAGRTDTGVHAKQMFAHFDTENPIENIGMLVAKLNGLLPPDIAIHDILPVREGAHARFDATGRTYEYWLTNKKSAFRQHLVTRSHFTLDYAKMNDAAEVILQEKDFASFCKVHTDVKTTICDVRRAYWEQRGDCWVFTIEADRFLRNMVRATVGTLIEVGRGNMTKEQLRQVLREKSRCAAGQSMPADGLYLVKIDYPEEIFTHPRQ